MKVLKFKAWHRELKEVLFATVDDNGGMIFVKPADMYEDEREEFGYRNTDLDIMQFTGLKDVSGKEIYEGDLLEGDNGEPVEVKYNEENTSFEPIPKMDISKLKIIGSKY